MLSMYNFPFSSPPILPRIPLGIPNNEIPLIVFEQEPPGHNLCSGWIFNTFFSKFENSS